LRIIASYAGVPQVRLWAAPTCGYQIEQAVSKLGASGTVKFQTSSCSGTVTGVSPPASVIVPVYVPGCWVAGTLTVSQIAAFWVGVAVTVRPGPRGTSASGYQPRPYLGLVSRITSM
jgi:hypothetical protein